MLLIGFLLGWQEQVIVKAAGNEGRLDCRLRNMLSRAEMSARAARKHT